MSDNEKTLTDAYYWLSMYKSGAITEGVAMEKVKEAIFEQPQLNDNQQVVLDWLKNRYTGNADPFGVAACLFSQTPRSEVIVATLKLTRDEQAQVLKIFANWTLEQEEE